MRFRKALFLIGLSAFTAAYLSACGGSSSGTHESQTASEAQADKASETAPEDTSEGEIEETGEKTELFNDQDVSVSVGFGKTEDGQVSFTLYFDNSAEEMRIISGNRFMINGEQAGDPKVKGDDGTTSDLISVLSEGESDRRGITFDDDGISSGDAVQIDFELQVSDDAIMALAAKTVEFGIDGDGNILLGDELKALGLAPPMAVEAETFPEMILFDQGGLKITGEGIIRDEENRRNIKLTVENGTSSEVEVRGYSAVLDGYDVSLPGEKVKAAPGETASGELWFMKNELEIQGIYSIHDISMSLVIEGDAVENSGKPTELVSAATDKESSVNERDASGLEEIYSADGIVIRGEPQAHQDANGSWQLAFLYENDTDDLIQIELAHREADGGGGRDYTYLFPHTKHWEENSVDSGSSYFMRVGLVKDQYNMELLAETEETEVVIP